MNKRVAESTRAADSEVTSSAGDGMRKFRPDIEGLRAVAVVSVVLAHAGLGLHGGYVGVDVFFVISGFLITRLLVRELDRDGRISFSAFYARRARRILPAATVVIVATMLAAREWMSPLRLAGVAHDAVYAAFSGLNWRLAAQGTNYFASTAPPSPFQHYWSLAVEEQFYVVWPLLLFLVALAGRRGFSRARTSWVLLAIIAASFTLSVIVTKSSKPYAYFGSHTRAWELALGALVAVGGPVLARMRPALSAQMTWLGMAAIVFAVLKFGDATPYPGSAVAIPVVGSAFVIAGGCAAPRRGAEILLGRRPMQFAGRVSYSWYLWHWPVLIIAPMALGHDLTTVQKWLVVVLSLALATLSFYLVEQPVRSGSFFKGSIRGLSVGAVMAGISVCTALVVAANVTVPGGSRSGVATAAVLAGPTPAATATPLTTTERALAAATALTSLPADLTPSLATAKWQPNDCDVALAQSTPKYPCGTFGDPYGTKTLVLIGDSHAGMWVPAVDQIARLEHWKMILLQKSGCPPADYESFVLPTFGRVYTECNTWRQDVFGLLKTIHPDYILVTGETHVEATSPTGMSRTVTALRASGAQVVMLEDTPYPHDSVPDCLAKNPNNIQDCSLQIDNPNVMLGSPQRQNEIEGAQTAGAKLIDPTSWFCTSTTCPAVVGNTLVYVDNSHISTAYALQVAPNLRAALVQVLSGAAANGAAAAAGPLTPREAAIAQAAKVEQLPAGLTPSLTNALQDLPLVHSCDATYAQTVPKFPCGTFGDPNGTKTVVLIGDSHAGMWVPALSAAATNEHWKMDLFEKANCSAEIYDYTVSQLGREYTECTAWRSNVFALLKQIHPDYVVIASLTRTIAKTASPLAMEQTVQTLQQSGAKVIFLEDTPFPKDEVPDCLAQHPNNIQTCSPQVSDPNTLLTSRGRANEVQGAAAAGAELIDPTPWFCTATVCPTVVGTTLVYIDNSHISATYARELTPDLQAALVSAVNSGAAS